MANTGRSLRCGEEDKIVAQDPHRRRSRQRRAAAVGVFMTLALGLAIFFESQATTTVIVVGPADTEEGLGVILDSVALAGCGPWSCPECWETRMLFRVWMLFLSLQGEFSARPPSLWPNGLNCRCKWLIPPIQKHLAG